jgi:predicted DNA binding CopG/RHH family protein
MKRRPNSLKRLPRLESDAQAERFITESDLTRYDLSALTPTRFEFAPKEARVNMRLPGKLLKAVKLAAAERGIPYQRFIRQILERAVAEVRP